LTATVTDNATPALSGSATITVNLNDVNETPVVQAATFTVDENAAASTAVGTVAFTDPDAGQTHTFSITAGNTDGAFAIDAATGAITVANPAALDFETTTTFALTVTVTDNGTPVLSGTATITVNVNDAPGA
jgi:VCBS repeat-containing protein